MKKGILFFALLSCISTLFAQKQLTETNYKAKTSIKNNRLIIVDYFATWCGPCKMMDPILNEIAKEYASNVDIYQIDVDKYPNTAAENMIEAMPTYLFYQNGKVVLRQTGAMNKQQFVELMRPFLGKNGVKKATTTTKTATTETSKSITTVTTQKWVKVPNVAQYEKADWKNMIQRVDNISVEQAIEIAKTNPLITYFFITTGTQLVLEKGVFKNGDAVFFSGKPWYGSAPHLADAYERK